MLINLIGPFEPILLQALSPQQWREQMHLNLDLVFYMTHHAKNYLALSKGHVVNFAFAGAELIKARTTATAYCIAKAGVLVLTKSFAAALASEGIRVNALSPGVMSSPFRSPARMELIKTIPSNREGHTQELRPDPKMAFI